MAKIAEHHTISQKTIDDLRAEERDWEANEVAQFLRKQAERKEIFFTLGDFPVKRAYTAADLASTPIEDIGLPGRYPFTAVPIRPCIARGRGRCGRSPASAREDTNKRFKYLIARARPESHRFRYADADGLRLRSSHERGRGRPRGCCGRYAGRHGGAVRRHRPREDLGLDDVNPSAWILLAMYIVLAESAAMT